MNIKKPVLELIRLTSTDLPEDVEKYLNKALENEAEGSAAQGVLKSILKNVELARENSTPICQDTGTPIFFIHYPDGWSTQTMRTQICEAVEEATRDAYLRPNAVDTISGTNSGNNLGDGYFPTTHFEPHESNSLVVELILKGGGCENVGNQYALPDSGIGAGRDLEGVRKSALDAVHQAQGKGCAPGILGISIGGDRGSSFVASKEALLRKLGDYNPDQKLNELEKNITTQANQLGIGPMGFGGNTTVLDTKITSLHRLPASYFVTVSYMCWAYRRRKMTIQNGSISYQ